jgi:predicted GNAT family N-acyltransferase
LAVLKEFRGSGIARMLVSAAMTWMQQNPTFFNPSITSMGMDKFASLDEVPVWKGLVCVHAQIQVAKTWAKWGFQLDEGMGEWNEEGIQHVGMFQRLNLDR